MRSNNDDSLAMFVRHFLMGRINWWAVPRVDAIRNYGSIVSFVLYRKDEYQVELFIVPYAPSSFTLHRHPDVDSYEFPLSGDNLLYLDSQCVLTQLQVEQWLQGHLKSEAIHISNESWHSGQGNTPYAFLSLQKWLHGVVPTSVGLNWEGLPSSSIHFAMLQDQV